MLFTDLVGYSLLSMDQQKEYVGQLQQIVQSSPQFRASEANGDIVSLPTGDGMALAFFQDPTAPAQCALEVAAALKEQAAPETADGNPQRPGLPHGRRECQRQPGRGRYQHGATGNGLWGRGAHPDVEEYGGRAAPTKPMVAVSHRSRRMHREARCQDSPLDAVHGRTG